MEIAAKLPVTLEERLEMGEELRIPASWEEFLDLLEECEYRIEYNGHEIISFTTFETPNHELICAKLFHLFGNLFSDSEYDAFASNLALHIPGFVRRHYNADVAVVKGETENVTLRGQMVAVANPVLVVEVLSESTRNYDLGTKQRNYRKIPSLQQILFIESTERLVTSHTRLNGANEWRLVDFTEPSDEIPILGEGSIKLADLYKKVI